MDAYESRKRDWEDLDVTKEELENFKDCLKKEEFRKLLIEYAEEVTDPENRKVYEKEIIQFEKERGVDVTFVKPEPGYVIKTSVNGEKKCFLNISKSDIVARLSSQPSYEQGQRGLQWSIPYTLIPPRDDLDKKNVRCMVFDVVFHPDTIYLTSKNARFKEMVNNTAMDGVEKNFQVKLDRKNLKFPKINYKGVCHPTVIRKPTEKPDKQERGEPDSEIYQKLISSYEERHERQAKRGEKKPKRVAPATTYYKENTVKSDSTDSKYVTPKFTVKHQSDIELEDFRIGKDAKLHATVPKKLVIGIDLPLLKSSSDATLDVQETCLTLRSEKPAKYLLELPLPYPVNADAGNAKFDPKYKKLVVSLPVIRTIPISNAMEDSGVESEQSSPVAQLTNDPVTDSSSGSLPNDPMPKLVEESEIAPVVTGLHNKSESVKGYEEAALRTSIAEDVDEFMNPNIKYSLPAFNCNVYGSQLAVTINVKNVDSTSIHRRFLRNNSGVQILFASVGAGFFPQYYSLCFKIAENALDPDSLTIEVWDNNVVFTVSLTSEARDRLVHYYVGRTHEFMEQKDFPTAASFQNQLQQLMATGDLDEEKNRTIQVQNEENSNVVISVSSHAELKSEEGKNQESDGPKEAGSKPNRSAGITKTRSISESSGDEISSNGSSSVVLAKGILKSRRSNFSRSVSESSADENGTVVSSVDYQYGSVQDFNSESECSSLKKTVRFNDVVSRQLFRSNASILGQRKKKQRKLRNKKKDERRLSESENSETEERDKFKHNTKDNAELENSDAVKSILHRDDKEPEKQKTANIEISKSTSNSINKHSSHMRKSSIEEESVHEENGEHECEEEAHVDNNLREISKDSVKAEFKSDLIFDLDM